MSNYWEDEKDERKDPFLIKRPENYTVNTAAATFVRVDGPMQVAVFRASPAKPEIICRHQLMGAWECPCARCQANRERGPMADYWEKTGKHTQLADRVAFVGAADAMIAYVKERRREKVGSRGLANLQRL